MKIKTAYSKPHSAPLKVHFVRKLIIEFHPQPVKYWRFGMKNNPMISFSWDKESRCHASCGLTHGNLFQKKKSLKDFYCVELAAMLVLVTCVQWDDVVDREV